MSSSCQLNSSLESPCRLRRLAPLTAMFSKELVRLLMSSRKLLICARIFAWSTSSALPSCSSSSLMRARFSSSASLMVSSLRTFWACRESLGDKVSAPFAVSGTDAASICVWGCAVWACAVWAWKNCRLKQTQATSAQVSICRSRGLFIGILTLTVFIQLIIEFSQAASTLLLAWSRR